MGIKSVKILKKCTSVLAGVFFLLYICIKLTNKRWRATHNIMNAFDSFNRTAATIKILNAVQDLRNTDQDVVAFEGVPQYNNFSGVVYLFIDSLNIALTADEFGGDVEVQVYNHDDDDTIEMTFREFCVWKGL